jgi:hypothetical protein
MLLLTALLSTSSAQDLDFGSSGTASVTQDQYVIQTGDTLWDISTAFMGDSYYWPRLWSYNDYITNPHWIYPGNVVYFNPSSLLDPPSMTVGGATDVAGPYMPEYPTYDGVAIECGPDLAFVTERPSHAYRTTAFLAQEEDVEVWGHLANAKSGRLTLGEGDRVYLRLEDVDAVGCGDVVSIFRQGEKVRHPDNRKIKYGNLYDVVADARIVHVDEDTDTVTAVIRQSYSAVKRGDMVGPPVPVVTAIAVSPPQGELEGTIVAREGQELYSIAAVGETVFIDRGQADGLRVGNSFYVVHHRDEALSLVVEEDLIPDQVAARIVVTRVDENVSTGVIVDARRRIAIGDQVKQEVD